MKISFGTRIQNIAGINGYGAATLGMLKSLERLGYVVTDNDDTADVEIWFDQPQHIVWGKAPYRIAYFPWESTRLPEEWDDFLNTADEVWTPSPLIASWMPAMGITKPVYVYEHGIDHVWEPRQREDDGFVKYLIVGAEATRKNGWTASFNYTRLELQKSSLTMKLINSSWLKLPTVGRKSYINETYSYAQMQQLFYDHDCLIHLSSGEGFGLPPLQAIASGMPAVVVDAWAPYRRFLDPSLCVPAELVKSSWEIHPGKVFRPDWDAARKSIQHVYDNFAEVSDFAFTQAPLVHKSYDWDDLTSQAFGALEKRLQK